MRECEIASGEKAGERRKRHRNGLMCYNYFYYLLENNIFVARNAEFFENSLIVQKASGSHGLLEVSGSDIGLELIQEDDTQPFENTSEMHDEVTSTVDVTQNARVLIRISARIPQAPDRYCFNVDAEEHELGDLNEPPNYKAALLDPKFDKWLEDMNMKVQSMKDNQVWYLVNLPPNGRTVRSKWLFKKKTDMDGNVHTFKARLVAKGYTQTYSADYGETFSPITYIRAIRILLDIVAFYDYEIWKIDIKTTFLNSHLSEDVDIVKLEGFVDPKHPNKDMVLVYGVKPKAELKVSCYADASFQTDKDDTKSQTEYVFVLNGGAVDWKSAKQSTIAMSSTEAEYNTTAEASMEPVWVRKFIDGLGDVTPSNKRPIEILCDNKPSIAMANDPGIIKGARHFQKKYHYIREVIQDGEIVLKKVYTYDNVLADVPHSLKTLSQLRDK
ncbi:retrotransposon protein, putative, ty1-copia subclass [Tanacetum coccineum]